MSASYEASPGRDCLEDDVLVQLVEGVVDDPTRAKIEAHLDACDGCRNLVAHLGRGLAAESELASTTEELAAGGSLGRFTISKTLGEGGVGVVYCAWDPRLRRHVALKVLRGGSPAPLDRLLEEARVVAAIKHPNVVSVYEVDQLEYRTVLVMEYFEGGDLDHWTVANGPSRRRLLQAYLEAGSGLAAAHRAGVVHRDFKPSNVLLSADGRAAVSDFGMATRHDDASTDSRYGGTIGYAAPEILDGLEVGPAADQYSWSFAVWRAVSGTSPPAGRGRLPRRLAEALERGLRLDPAARFATMDDLLEAARPRRRGRVFAVAGLSLGALAAAALVLGPGQDRCTEEREAFEQAWNESRSSTLRANVEASSLPGADELGSIAVARLDEYADRWTSAHQATCEAESPDEDQLRCLARMRLDFDALVEQVAATDAVPVANIAQLVSLLGAPSACRSSERAVDAELAEVFRSAQLAAFEGDLDTALSMLPTAPDPAAHPYVAARIELTRASILHEGRRFADAASAARIATESFADLGEADFEVEARILQYELGVGLGEDEPAIARLRRLAAEATPRATKSAFYRGRLKSVDVVHALARGQPREAVVAAKEAMEIFEVDPAADETTRIGARHALALSQLASGDVAAATASFRACAEAARRFSGPSSVLTLAARLGEVESRAGRDDPTAVVADLEALAHSARGSVPPTHWLRLRISSVLVAQRLTTDDPDPARTLALAEEIVERGASSLSPGSLVSARFNRAMALAAAGRVADALRAHEAIEAMLSETSSDPTELAFSNAKRLAVLSQKNGDLASAQEHASRALGMARRLFAADSSRLADILRVCADIAIARGQRVEAVAWLREALGMPTEPTFLVATRVGLRSSLARALGVGDPRSRALLEEARTLASKGGLSASLAEVERHLDDAGRDD